jgi:hypothetical protein
VSKNGRPLPGVNIRPRPRGGDDDDDEDEDDDDDDDDDEDDRYDEENDLVYGGQVKAVDI